MENCKHENEHGNFCSKCGTPLKEKCSECGKTECLSKIKRIQEEARQYADKKVSKKVDNFLVRVNLLGSALSVIAAFLTVKITSRRIDIVGFSAWVIIVVVFWAFSFVFLIIWEEKRKKAKEDFFKKHPDYAEILKKAEEK